MDESESKNEKPKEGRRFSQDQYDMLIRCSEKKDMTEWNEWRKDHSDEDVWLEDAGLNFAHLEGALLLGSHLEGAKLRCGHLKDANLANAHLEKADLVDTHLEGTNFKNATLKSADFRIAVVSGSTSFCYCIVDLDTDFREVGLDNARIDPGTKQLLEYNIRRKNWEEWYKQHWFWRWLVRLFWAMSDYGMSTKRVIIIFLGLSLFFAAIYANWACWFPPGVVSNLAVEPHMPIWHYFLLVLFRPVYFSVVTMTTLGFGDMFADSRSIAGHLLLMVQVIFGYVLLGALITRFAVLFTAGGPAGEFADEKEKKRKPQRTQRTQRKE